MDAQGWVITALLGSIAFMARHYFIRIERHLSLNHRVVNLVHRHDTRLTLLERAVFGKPLIGPPELVENGEMDSDG